MIPTRNSIKYLYGTLRKSAGELYGTMETGSGLCQTRVPCESRVPPGKKSRDG
jgi:epoxyqueuosine reductase